jgi:hypothetical protein
MSKFEIVEGTLVYVKVAEPSKKYQSEDTEYSVGVVVGKAVAKDWNKKYPKQKAKEYEPAEFETKFKMAVPAELEGDDEVFVITLKRAITKDGERVLEEKHRPRVYLDTNEGERVDITVSRPVSNGSKGKVAAYITTNSFGVFAKLQEILIQEDDFIEYEGGGASPFGNKKPVKAEPENKAATQARASKEAAKAVAKPAKPLPKSVTTPDEDDPEESPF